MALTKCGECGGEVSSAAAACPHCGARTPTRPAYNRRQARILLLVGVPGLLLGLLAFLVIRDVREDEDRRARCQQVAATLDRMAALGSIAEDERRDLQRLYDRDCR